MKPAFPPYMPLPALEPDSEFFWRAAREGRLVMTRCSACGWIVHPARPVCSRCRGRELAPHELSGRGRVVSFTVNHQRWMPGLEEPYAIAVVERLIARANPVGLFSEDIDPVTGGLLGNFPQAYTHVGLIHAATTIGELLEARDGCVRAWV